MPAPFIRFYEYFCWSQCILRVSVIETDVSTDYCVSPGPKCVGPLADILLMQVRMPPHTESPSGHPRRYRREIGTEVNSVLFLGGPARV